MIETLIKGVDEQYREDFRAAIQDLKAEFSLLKKKVADVVCDFLTNLQNKYNEIINSDELDKILDSGKEKTEIIAKKKYEEAKYKMGFHR
jgi:tryptophanyl-tRNA synthetase